MCGTFSINPSFLDISFQTELHPIFLMGKTLLNIAHDGKEIPKFPYTVL